MKIDIKKLTRAELYQYLESQNQDIASCLKILRTYFGWTQKQLAQRTNSTVRIVNEIEAGKGNPTIKTINKIFKPFGLTIGLNKIDYQ